MKEMTKAEFIAIADELIELETLDKDMAVFYKKENGKVSFYTKYSDPYRSDEVETSYYYSFSVTEDAFNNAMGSIDTVKLYNTLFREK